MQGTRQKITIGINFKSFDLKYREIVLFAILRMEDVINSPIFYEMLEDEISKSNSLEGELSHWKHNTVKEIYEQLFPIVLYLNTYYTINNVIGYGTPKSKDIFINTKYLSTYSIEVKEDLMEIGSNLLHEHSHDCGFDHDFRSTSRRKNSLSYIMNRAYERAYRKFYNLPVPMPVFYTPWYKKVWRKIWN